MKKLLWLLLVLCLAATVLIACNESKNTPSSNVETSPTESGTKDDGGSAAPVTYQIVYNANGGAFADGSEQITVTEKENDALTAPTSPTRENYTFAGWAKKKNGTELWDFSGEKATQDMTLYATWKSKAAVILSVDGASIDGNSIFLQVGSGTESVSLSGKVVCSENSIWKLYYDRMGQTEIPTKIAAGLYGSLQNGENIFYIVVTSNDGTQTTVYDLTVFRNYIVPVMYYGNGALLKTDMVETGTTYAVAYRPNIEGYTFNGWQTTTGAPAPATMQIWEAQVFNAGVTANTYTVTLNANGGVCGKTSVSVTYDSSYTVSSIIPTRTGYTFLGWYNGSTKYTSGTWEIAADFTVTASWQANTYQITYADTNEDGVYAAGSSKTQTVTYDSAYTLIASTRDGATFLGWYNGETKWENGVYQNANSVTLTARWDFTRYNITYDPNGGEMVENPATYVTADDVTLNALPNRELYRFLGWYDANGVRVTNLKGLYRDLQLTARWECVFTRSGNTLTGVTEYGRATYTDLTIPSEIDGVAITTIGENAFSDCTSLTSVTFGANSQLTSIGSSAFSGCTSLNGVYISNLAAWCEIVFKDNPLYYAHNLYINGELATNITIPANVTSIESSAFNGCTSLTSIEIPDSVTSIGKGAFRGCSALESITIPFVGEKAGVTASDAHQYPFGYIFGGSSYTGSTATTQYYYGSSTSSTTSTTYYIPTSLKSVTVTGGNILYGAFYGCSNLTSIEIPASVTSIGGYAFRGCTSLASVTFEENSKLKNIGNYAFYVCTSLKSIEIPASVTSIGGYAFYNCTSLTSLTLAENSQLTSIEYSAFYNCTSLASINIPANVTSIGNSAFRGCTSLTSVTFSENSKLTSIEWSAFNGCTSLTSIEIPANLTSIGKWAFDGCTSLKNITIPASVMSIGACAFRGCTSLQGVYISDLAAWCGIAFENGKDANPLYYAPNLYINGKLATDITIPASVTSIGIYAFYACTSLISIKIPASVTSIGDYAFYACTSLANINFNGTIAQWKSIGKGSTWNDNTGNYTIHCTDGDIAK